MMNLPKRSAKTRLPQQIILRLCFRALFFCIWISIIVYACGVNLHPETRTMTRELEDSLVVFMQIRNDDEFFRKYIAFNVRFTLRHKMALNDTVINRELKTELAKMALIQEAQRRVDAIQQRTE